MLAYKTSTNVRDSYTFTAQSISHQILAKGVQCPYGNTTFYGSIQLHPVDENRFAKGQLSQRTFCHFGVSN